MTSLTWCLGQPCKEWDWEAKEVSPGGPFSVPQQAAPSQGISPAIHTWWSPSVLALRCLPRPHPPRPPLCPLPPPPTLHTTSGLPRPAVSLGRLSTPESRKAGLTLSIWPKCKLGLPDSLQIRFKVICKAYRGLFPTMIWLLLPPQVPSSKAAPVLLPFSGSPHCIVPVPPSTGTCCSSA